MDVFAIQLDIAWHDKQANHRKVRGLLDRAHIPPGSMIVLPEMFATGFSMDVAAVADDAERETESFLHAIAKERKSIVVGGLVTRRDGRGVNEAIVAHPDDGPPRRYQKIHPFTLGGESDHYHAGKNLLLFGWNEFQIAPFICYDLRFPEIFRIATARGAHVLAVIASWPIAREEHWLTLLRARAIENQCYVVGVNRCGKDPEFTYGGRTQIIGPMGGIIADAGTGEGIIRASLSLPALADYRQSLPFLKDMRPEFLGSAPSETPPAAR
jgi:predicted amidohydrolase